MKIWVWFVYVELEICVGLFEESLGVYLWWLIFYWRVNVCSVWYWGEFVFYLSLFLWLNKFFIGGEYELGVGFFVFF